MSQHAQSFFSGVIIQSLVMAFILGATSLIIDEKFTDIEANAKDLQSMKPQMTILAHELPRLTSTMRDFQGELKGLIEHQRNHEKLIPVYEAWKTKVNINLDYLIKQCETNEEDIEKCKARVYNNYKKPIQ